MFESMNIVMTREHLKPITVRDNLIPFPTYTNFHTVDHDFGILKNRSGVGTKFVVDRSNSWCPLMDRDDT